MHIRYPVLGALVALVAAGPSLPVAAEPQPAPPAAERFTVVVLPDTQKYAMDPALAGTISAQTQWVVDHSDELNVVMTVHLGDLVEHWARTEEWDRVRGAFDILDAQDAPYSVVLGNHDLNITTGQSHTFDQYFGPATVERAAQDWPEGTTYAGHLGSGDYGPDPVDRGNKDSATLFSAGGKGYLLLSLEYESPQYSLDWAQRVLDAHPDRRVILATHGFITTAGTRSNTVTRTDTAAKSAVQVWDELVRDNCQIFLVVNGHWSSSQVAEARRTDPNACGQPVHQILSNYQSRVNGGDGWLRYYTFDPQADTIEAFTYSPTRGQFETDDSSRFTLPYLMSAEPPTTETVVASGSSWRFRYAGGAWPVGWTGVGFSDAGWSSGAGPLGFGAGSVVTRVDVPPPTSGRPLSMLFRRSFVVDDVGSVVGATIQTQANDGQAVWVNGTEVRRTNLPAGTLSSGTYATAAPRVGEAPVVTVEVPPGLLVEGANVVAVSSHLNYRSTPDVTFDLALSLTRDGAPPPPPPAEPPGTPVVSAEVTPAGAVRISWQPGDGTPVTEFEVLRDGQSLITADGSVRHHEDATAVPGATHTYGVVARDGGGRQSAAGEVVVVVPDPDEPPTTETVVASGSSWRFRYAGGAWPAGWTGVGFPDAGWSAGAGPLGFGAGSVVTRVDVPPPTSARPLSMLFRRSFVVDDVGSVVGATIQTQANDGQAVWVNGTEVRRTNLPAGTLSSGTYATAAPRVGEAPVVTVEVPPGLLVEGANVVAVSSHLNYRSTPDVTFDLALTLTRR